MAKTVSIESELRIIRTICEIDDEVRTKALSILTEDHFGSPVGNQLFARILGLIKANKPVPRIATLREDTAIDEDAQEALIASDERCVDESDAVSTMDLLEAYRKMRVVYGGVREVVKNLAEIGAESIDDSIAELERVVLRARSSYEEQHLITSGAGSNALEVVDRVLSNERPDRIMTGFTRFDEATSGFARKDLVLVAANTGGGKTVMAEQLAINAYIRTGQNRNTALVSFEMDIEELYARLIANLTKLSFENIYLRKWIPKPTDDEEMKKGGNEFRVECYTAWESFNKHGSIVGSKFTIYCPTIDVTPNQIGALLRPGDYDLVIIDYVGLVGTEKEAALWENLGETTRQFKGVARRNDCVVVVMAQMDDETGKIKYSKAMQHHSSYVWKWKFDEDSEETNQVIVEQDKARHCKPFPFPLIANFGTMEFRDPKADEGPQDISSKAAAEERERKKNRAKKGAKKDAPKKRDDEEDGQAEEGPSESAESLIERSQQHRESEQGSTAAGKLGVMLVDVGPNDPAPDSEDDL